MKALIFMGFNLLMSSSFAYSTCSQIESNFLDKVQMLFERGIASNVDVKIAKINEMQAKFSCGEMAQQDFCQVAVPEAVDLVAVTTLGYTSGVRSIYEVAITQKNLREVRALCK